MSRITLRSIRISDLNGFRERDNRCLVDLRGGLDVVYAPNRTGKSSLATAYRLLLGEKMPEYDQSCAVSGELGPQPEARTDGAISSIDRRNATVTVRFVGGVAAPSYSRGSRAPGYVLHLPEMLVGLTGDERKVTSAALHGGSMKAPDRPANLTVPANLRTLLAAVNAEKTAAKEYETCNTELKELEVRIKRASEASRTAALLRYSSLELQRNNLIAEYSGIDRQIPGSAEHARTLKQTLEDAHTACNISLNQIRTVSDNGTLSAADSLSLADAESLQRGSAEISEASGSLHTLTQERAAEAAKRDELAAELGGAVDLHSVSSVGAVLFQELPNLADRSREEQSALKGYAVAHQSALEVKRDADTQSSDELKAQWKKATDALRETVRTASAAGREGPERRVIVALVAAAVLTLFGFVPGVGLVGPILSLTGLILLAVAILLRRKPTAISAANDGAAPDTSHTNAVDKLVTELQTAGERAAEIDQRRRAWNEVCTRLDGLVSSVGEQHAQQLEAMLEQVKSRSGVTNIDPYRLADFLLVVEKWREANLKVTTLETKIQMESERIESSRNEIRQVMASFCFTPRNTDAPEGSINALERWYELSAAARKAQSAVVAAEIALRTYLQRIGVLHGNEIGTSLDDGLSIAEAREAGTSGMPSPVAAFQAVCSKSEALVRDHFWGAVPDASHVDSAMRVAGLEIDDPDALQRAIEAEDAAAERLAELMQRKGSLEAQIKAFESSDSATSAVRALKDAQPAVETRMRERSLQFADYLVRTVVSEKAQSEASPEILTLTNANLRSIDTELEIRVLPGGANNTIGPLVVNDGRNGRLDQPFEDLATSAKINVVLALKLAILKQSETDGTSLPIIVDEVMAVADENIRAGIARLLVNEAKTRQVIVMTNRPEDVSALRKEALASGAAIVEHSIGGGEVSVPAAVQVEDLPRFTPTMGPVSPDLTIDFDRHSPSLLPDEGYLAKARTAPTIREALGVLDADVRGRLEPILQALNSLHEYVRERCPIVAWGQINNEPWTMGAYRSSIEQLLRDCAGMPDTFWAGLKNLSRFNTNNQTAAKAWLEANAALGSPKPTFAELRDVASKALNGAANTAILADWCAGRYAGFAGVRDDV